MPNKRNCHDQNGVHTTVKASTSTCQPWKGAESVTTERDGRLKRHLNDEMSDEIKKMHALNENAHFE